MEPDERSAVGSGGGAPGPRGVGLRTAAAAATLLLAAGCGGDGPGPDDRPAELVRVSAATDTVVANQRLEAPLTVRVESASGSAVPGVTVSFEVAAGSGTVDPDAVSTDGSGEARSTFTAENVSGTSRVRAALPDASGVDAVIFEIRIVPPGVVRLEKVGGDEQEAEPGSQLPESFLVRTVTGDGEPTGGVRVAWTVVEEPTTVAGAGAALTADTVYTGADGRARAVLTLAEAEGEHTVRAVVPGSGDTVRFTATASEGAAGGMALDSVRPDPIRAGEPATLHGSGFGEDASELTVTVEGVEAAVSTASDGRLEIDVPGFEERCLPARTVGVRVRTSGRQSNGRFVGLRPARRPLTLEAGEVRTLTEPEQVRCLQLDAADAERELRLQVQSAARTVAPTPMRLVTRTGAAPGADPGLEMVGQRREPAFADRSREALASRRELELRRNIREELRRVGARPARAEAGDVSRLDARLRGAHVAGPPAVGDTLGINFYVRDDLSVTCQDTLRRIGARVRAVGQRVVLAEDTLAGEVDGFTSEDYRRLRDEFDTAIFATDSAYFGSPTDIDHNDRVIVLVTPEVNMLSGSEVLITGFFNSADLADSGDPEGDGTSAEGTCATSNEAELLYLLAPDPEGRWGQRVSLEEARGSIRGTSAHEHQHLLNAGTRLIREGGGFDDLIDTWLDEGLSHVAEEVVGMRLRGLAPRQNLTHEEAGGGTAEFDAYFLQNLLRLGIYLGNPSDTRTLSASDPGGNESLEMRGFAWSFLRWLADSRVPDGTGGFLGGPREEELFRAMADGGPELLTGTDNVLRAVEVVTGRRPAWGELVAEFSPVAHVDDDVPGVPVRFALPSWDLRDVLPAVSERTGRFSGYPLRFTDAGYEATAYEFEVRGSTQIYFRFASSEPPPAFSLRLSSRLGGPVPPSAAPQVTVVRVR